MRDGEQDMTIGYGGWALVGLAGVVAFFALRYLDYDTFPAVVFAGAVALVVYLILYRLALAIIRQDDEDEARRVRKIVPGSAEGGMRVSGVEGSQTVSAKAVRVGPEGVAVAPVSSMVVTPLADLQPAPVIAPVAVPPPVSEKAAAEVVPFAGLKAANAAAKAAAKARAEAPKAAPKPKADAKPKAGVKPKAGAETPAAAKSWTEAKPRASAESSKGFATKAEPKPEPKPEPKAKVAPKAKAEGVAAKPAAKPKAASKPKAEAKPVGLVRLKAPRKGMADDLKEIEGIGPTMEKLVNDLGFYHFDQIAAWSEADVALVDAEMKTFKGRITRDKWVAQARIIVAEGLEAFRERAKTNNY
jgi:predicted flap endonuclease-1-like 5' DNA nuclease